MLLSDVNVRYKCQMKFYVSLYGGDVARSICYRELISNCAHFSFCQVCMDPRPGTDTSGPGEAVFAI